MRNSRPKARTTGNEDLPGTSELWLGGRDGGGAGHDWLHGHVTSALRGALHGSLMLCCLENFHKFTLQFYLSVRSGGTVVHVLRA